MSKNFSPLDWDYAGLKKIVSGGQDGVDLGALRAAKALGVATGGWAPKGWRTAHGSAPELGSVYGLCTHISPLYPPRTELNVVESDGTLIIASNMDSAGTALTRALATKHAKPVFAVQLPNADIPRLVSWLRENLIETLNVAGNHEKAAYHEAAAFAIVSNLIRLCLRDVSMSS